MCMVFIAFLLLYQAVFMKLSVTSLCPFFSYSHSGNAFQSFCITIINLTWQQQQQQVQLQNAKLLLFEQYKLFDLYYIMTECADDQILNENISLRKYVQALQYEYSTRNLQNNRLAGQLSALRSQNTELTNLIHWEANTESEQLDIEPSREMEMEMENLMRQIVETRRYLQFACEENKQMGEVLVYKSQQMQIIAGNLGQFQTGNEQNEQNSQKHNQICSQLALQNNHLKDHILSFQDKLTILGKLMEEHQQLKAVINQLEQQINFQLQQQNVQNMEYIQALKQQFIAEFRNENTAQIIELKFKHADAIQIKQTIIIQLRNELKKISAHLQQKSQHQFIALRKLQIATADLADRLSLSERQYEMLKNQVRSLEIQIKEKDFGLLTREKSLTQFYRLQYDFRKKEEDALSKNQQIRQLHQNIILQEQKYKFLQKQHELNKKQAINRNSLDRQQSLQNILEHEQKFIAQIQQIKSKIDKQQESFNRQLQHYKQISTKKQLQNNLLTEQIARLTEQNKLIISTYEIVAEYDRKNNSRNLVLNRNSRLKLFHYNQVYNLTERQNLGQVIQQLRRQLKQTRAGIEKLEKQNKKLKSTDKQKNEKLVQNQGESSYSDGSVNRKSISISHRYKKQQKTISSTNTNQYGLNIPKNSQLLTDSEQHKVKIKIEPKNTKQANEPKGTSRIVYATGTQNSGDNSIENKIKKLKLQNKMLKQELCY